MLSTKNDKTKLKAIGIDDKRKNNTKLSAVALNSSTNIKAKNIHQTIETTFKRSLYLSE